MEVVETVAVPVATWEQAREIEAGSQEMMEAGVVSERFTSSVVSLVSVAAAATFSATAVVEAADDNVASIVMVVRGAFVDSVRLGKIWISSSSSVPVGRISP